MKEAALKLHVETTSAAKKEAKFKKEIITGSLDCQNSPFCHVKVCYDNISLASPAIDYPTKNCSKQQQGDKFFSLFVYITCIRPFLPMKKEKRTCEIFLSPVSFSFST